MVATETERHEGLIETGSPDWGEGFREHVESLVQKLEDAAVDLGPGLMPLLRGGLNVSFYGGKGFTLTFNGEGMPIVVREDLGLRPDPGLYLRCEMWALEALLDPTTKVEEDDPETFFIMAGWEMEGDFDLLQRLTKIAGPTQASSGTSARIGAMLGRFDRD